MKTIQMPQKDLRKMFQLRKSFYDVYGNDKTVWSLDDLDEMRTIGQEFIETFAVNFKK